MTQETITSFKNTESILSKKIDGIQSELKHTMFKIREEEKKNVQRSSCRFC